MNGRLDIKTREPPPNATIRQHGVVRLIDISIENSTLSIDLRYSWTNETVAFNVITKSAPVLNSQAL